VPAFASAAFADNLPGFVHGIDLIEHRLPPIPWAASKQFRSAVDGHAAQAIRVAQLAPRVGADRRIVLACRSSGGFTLIPFLMIQSL
jgi:hypothetical protein